MDIEMTEALQALSAGLERLASRLEVVEEARRGEVEKITAAVESGSGEKREEATRREVELERRLAEAEHALAALQASGARVTASARKTLPAATVQLLAKQGIDAGDSVDVQSLDAALAGLSVEQRIAVKSQLMRTGALTL